MLICSLMFVLALCSFATAESDLPEHGHGITGHADLLYWQAHRDGLEVAEFQKTNYTGGAYQSGSDSLELPRETGLRAGLGYRFASGWEAGWNYTSYFASAESEINQADIGPTEVLHPASSIFAPPSNVTAVQGMGNLRFNAHDVEVSRWLPIDQSLDLRLFGGFRWAMIDQDFQNHYQYIYTGGQFPTTIDNQIENPLSMNGHGIRLGLESQWLMFGGVKLFGRGAGSVLAGNFHERILETSPFNNGLPGPAILNENSSSFTRAVPVLEAALGASMECGPWEVSGGYELNTWFNLGGRSTTNGSGDIVLDGLFFRVAYAH
jgi:hypothetical protein